MNEKVIEERDARDKEKQAKYNETLWRQAIAEQKKIHFDVFTMIIYKSKRRKPTAIVIQTPSGPPPESPVHSPDALPDWVFATSKNPQYSHAYCYIKSTSQSEAKEARKKGYQTHRQTTYQCYYCGVGKRSTSKATAAGVQRRPTDRPIRTKHEAQEAYKSWINCRSHISIEIRRFID
ncbi:hypothetical protein ACLMJK_009422 [Lecanora helva]